MDIGFVGQIKTIDKTVLVDIIEQGYILVIAPIAIGENQETYNINADFMAGEVAAALRADKFVLLTDTEGIYSENSNGDKTIENSLHVDDINQLIQGRVISGGMIPKVECCINALDKGVNKVHIIDGRVPHSILLEVFTDEGIGTMIVK